MFKNLLAVTAIATANAVKLAQTEYDCDTYSAQNIKVSYAGDQVTVAFDAPSTDKSAVNKYIVGMNEQEQSCISSPCTFAVSDFGIQSGSSHAAVVKPLWAEKFTVAFPRKVSESALYCDGKAEQNLKDAIERGADAEGVAILDGACKVDVSSEILTFEVNRNVLAQAINTRNVETAKRLIKYDGVDVNHKNTSDTGKFPLMYAAASGLPELI